MSHALPGGSALGRLRPTLRVAYTTPMETRAFAEQVLFGTRLADKLIRPDHLTDEAPGVAIAAPAAPGRPTGLAPVRRARAPFPSLSHLDRPEVRSALLHRFANHELMAIELMALALLRFPEAPRAFRRGVVQALFEEQEHFSLYHARLTALGGSFGEHPTSPFFWDALAGMSAPLDYVTGMSLTFEQANLDFTRHFRAAFATVGDAESAAILDRVYEDEVGHVKLGLVWFRKWLNPEDDWSAYQAALPPTLQPSRAKGIGYDVEGRRRAGFDDRWISQLRFSNRSKGRVPALHWFDPTAEVQLAGHTPPAIARQLQRDLETLPMFLCARDDVVRVQRPPREAFLAPLAEAGFVVPEFVTDDELPGRTFSALRPWAAIAHRDVPPALAVPEAARTPAHLFTKGWAVEQLTALLDDDAFNLELDPAIIGRPCADLAEIEAARDALRAAGYSVVAKAAFGTAGQGLQRIDAGLPGRWLRRALSAGPVVIEPWLDRVLDLGVQLTVGGATTVDGITRNLVDARGQHRGIALFKLPTGLPVALRRWLMSGGAVPALHHVGARVGDALSAAGHRGPASVDALVYRTAGGYRLKPIVEVNPRCSMGRVALAVRRRVARGKCAAWIQTRAEGITTELRTRRQRPDQPPLIVEASLPTTDPEGARFATVLYVAANLDALRARIGDRLSAVDPAFAS